MYINRKYKWAGAAIDMCDIMWIPHWGHDDGEVPEPQYQPDYYCDIWQYTSAGRLAGVEGDVDLNMLLGKKPLEYFTGKDGEPKMIYDPKKVIAIARAEVGYLEKNSNSQLDDKTANAGSKNYTKYARDLDALGFYNGRKQGVAWCDMFVDWTFVEAFGMEVALAITFQPYGKPNCGAGCKYSRRYYKNNGRLFDTPQPGDQIFFWPADRSDPDAVAHTGLVVDVDDTYVYTIEGNTSGASGVVANGGGVKEKKYKLNYARIAGYGRPNYGTEYKADPDELKKGDENAKVADLQAKLVALGYDLGTYGTQKNGVDGDFGSKTETALKNFQIDHGLTATGTYNAETREKMEEVVSGKKPDTVPEDPQDNAYVLIIEGDEEELRAIQTDHGGTLAAVDSVVVR